MNSSTSSSSTSTLRFKLLRTSITKDSAPKFSEPWSGVPNRSHFLTSSKWHSRSTTTAIVFDHRHLPRPPPPFRCFLLSCSTLQPFDSGFATERGSYVPSLNHRFRSRTSASLNPGASVPSTPICFQKHPRACWFRITWSSAVSLRQTAARVHLNSRPLTRPCSRSLSRSLRSSRLTSLTLAIVVDAVDASIAFGSPSLRSIGCCSRFIARIRDSSAPTPRHLLTPPPLSLSLYRINEFYDSPYLLFPRLSSFFLHRPFLFLGACLSRPHSRAVPRTPLAVIWIEADTFTHSTHTPLLSPCSHPFASKCPRLAPFDRVELSFLVYLPPSLPPSSFSTRPSPRLKSTPALYRLWSDTHSPLGPWIHHPRQPV